MLLVSHTVAACIEGDLKDVPLIAQVTSHIIFHAKYTRAVDRIQINSHSLTLHVTSLPSHLHITYDRKRDIFSLK